MMRLIFSQYGKDFELFDDKVNILAIENKSLFRKVILNFYFQTSDEIMTFSKNFEPFEFEKRGIFIPDPINPAPDFKKLLSVVNKKAEKFANEQFFEPLQNAKESLLILGDKISEQLDLNFSFCNDITASSLIKLLNFKVNTEELNEAERILKYLELMREYCKTNLFVFSGLALNFGKEELSELLESIIMKHFCVLLVEPQAVTFGEKTAVHIIDEDLCCIDSEEII